MPSPEMLAPDGSNAAATRVFGAQDKGLTNRATPDLRATVARYFPEIARGEGGPAILFIVESPDAGVVLTEVQPADELARMPAPGPEIERRADRAPPPPSANAARSSVAGKAVAEVRIEELPRAQAPAGATRMKRRQNGELRVPSGVGALRPDDIATIDVSKHGAGVLAPKPVSIISIVLKPGAAVPKRARPR
jgi:hypothetical protein